MNEVINVIPSYLITVTASVAFFIAFKILHNFVEHKIATAKTQQAKERWIYVQQLADTAVNSLVGKDIAGHEKFVQATSIVQSALEKQGIKNVDLKAIEAAIQSAYEKSPLTPTSNEKPYVFKGLEQTKLDKPKVQDNVNNTQPIESK